MSLDPIHPANRTEFTVLMALLMSVVAISIDAMLPALGIIAGDLGLSNPNHAQYVIGFLFAGLAAGQLVSGPLSDALGRKRVLYLGLALYLLGTVVCYLADDLTGLLAGRVLQGLGVSGPYVSAVSIVRDRYSGRQMAKIMSVIMMIFIMVPAIAPTVGQAVLLAGTWRDIFLMYLFYAAAIGLWIYLRLEETLPPARRIPFSASNITAGAKEVFGNRATRLYTICMGLCFGAFIGYLNSAQQIFQEQFKVGDLFTLYFGALAIVFGLASLANARFVERFGMQAICHGSFATIVAASAAFLALHALMPVTLVMFIVYAIVIFFAFGMVFGNLNALALEPMGHIAGIAAAITGASSSLISLSLGTAIGQMYNGTLVPVSAGFLLLGLVALALLRQAHRVQDAAGRT